MQLCFRRLSAGDLRGFIKTFLQLVSASAFQLITFRFQHTFKPLTLLVCLGPEGPGPQETDGLPEISD